MQTMKRFLSVFLCILFVLPGFVSLGMTVSATEFQVGDLVQIGTYPQTRVTDEELIEALDAQSAAWQSYGYYSGTYTVPAYPDSNGCMTASNYMQYADVTYAGDRYRGVKFVQYRPTLTGLVTTDKRSGQDENGYFVDTTYWFEWEPLLWRVLDPAVGLVMTESVIDSQPFHNYRKTGGQDDYGYDAHWGDPDRGHYANNYACSDIRAWLTDELDADSFLNTAFTAAQRGKITAATLDNSAYRREVSDYGCEATTDKVFLLSWKDVTTKAYGFSVNDAAQYNARLGQGTDYAKCQGLLVNTTNGYSQWLLRTAGDSSKNVCNVTNAGACDVYCVTESTNYGIRPAMHVDLDYAYTTAEYTAKFVADGKTVGKVKYTADTTSIQDKEPAVPAKEGYDGAWPTYTLLVGGVTVEAVYTPNTYSVTWDVEGTTTTEQVTYGEPIELPANPTKPGSTFIGWTPDVPDTMPAQDMTFTAQFSQDQYNAVLIADGKQIAVIPYTYGQTSITLPDVPAKEGYTGKWPAYTLPAGGVTITAVYTPNNYSVTWDVEGTTTTAQVKFGDPIVKPADPTKEGYDFTGWTPDVPDTMPAQDMIFTAQFEAGQYNAVLMADGKQIAVIPYTYGQTSITLPDVPAKEGYTGAWPEYTLSAGGVTITAVYTPNTYSVTWDVEGTTTTAQIAFGDPIEKPADPKKEGYDFTGWTPEVPETMPAKDMTFTAQFSPSQYNAVIKADGKQIAVIPYTYGQESITLPDVPAKEGYTGAWPAYTLSIGGVTIEAVYTPNTYSVTWDVEGTTTTAQVTFGDPIEKPADPTKEGSTFIGWTPEVPETMPAKDMTFTAQFSQDQYKAVIKADGKQIAEILYTYGQESITLPDVPAKEGYTGAWPAYTLPIGGVTIEAVYTPNTYSVTWDVEGTTTTAQVTFGDPIEKPADPKKDGYDFNGWTPDVPATMPAKDITFTAQFSPSQYDAVIIADGQQIAVIPYTYGQKSITLPDVPEKEGYTGAWPTYTLSIGGVTITAVYTVNTYTVTWDVEGTTTTAQVKFGDPIEKPADPTKEGYDFNGWTPEIPDTMPAKDMTFTAQFSPSQYDAVIMADGQQIAVIPYTYGQKSITLPAVPAKEGYTGTWPTYTLPIGGVTIEAVYTVNTYTVTWIVDGKTTKTQVTFGEAIEKPADPTKEGSTFIGWTPDIPDTMPAKDMTFTAQFSQDQYEAVIMADGKQIAVIPYVYGQKSIALPDVPEKEGYTGAWPTYTLPIGGVTITAVYTKNNYTVTWVVDGKTTTASVPFGSAIAKPADPVKSGYQFTGWTPAVPATMPAKDLTFTAQFAQIVITSLRVVKTPNKTVYTYRRDKSVDLTGMVLEATYSDGSKKTVTNMSDVKVTGYSAKPRGDKTVVVEFEGKTAQFTVNVKYTWWQWLIIIFLFGWLWY